MSTNGDYPPIDTETSATEWAINGDVVDEIVSETRSFDELELEWEVDTGTAEQHLRPLEGPSGQIDTLSMANGSYAVIDNSGGDALVPLAGPTNRGELHPPGWYYVTDYDEEIAGETGERVQITTTFIPATPEQ